MNQTKPKAQAAARSDWPSVNKTAQPLVEALLRRAGELRLGVTRTPGGCTIVDAGIAHPGGLEAGRIVTEICMRGPTTTPSSTAIFMPRSAPEASRTVVMPSLSVVRRFSAIWKKRYENGRCIIAVSSKSS